MSTPALLGIAVGLAMDTFAVAIAASVALGSVSPRQVFRFAFHFGLFQAMMPMIGWLAGSTIEQYIVAWDHWVAFGLLAFVGGKAIYAALAQEHDERPDSDPTRGWMLVTLATATSIDALAVGLTFAMLRVRIWYPCLVIGIVTAAFTVAGMLTGSRLGRRFGQRIEVLGGLVLIGIGLKILVQHLAQ